MYHDKNLIFSQNDRNFKKKFAALNSGHICPHFDKVLLKNVNESNNAVNLKWRFQYCNLPAKSSVKQCFKQVFIKYLPSTIFEIYDVIVYVICCNSIIFCKKLYDFWVQKMGKKSVDDKMHIQTLREQGLAYTSVYERKRGSGRPRTVRTPSNVEQVWS